MKLNEIELDLPYQKNIHFIEQLQNIEGMEYLDATKKDYELNWKEMRRKFQLETRCMTSMIERTMKSIYTKDCWKILIECVEECSENAYKNLLGVYVVQIEFNKDNFFIATDMDKKKIIIDVVLRGVQKLSNFVEFDVGSICDACDGIIESKYKNEWYWNRPVRLEKKTASIKIVHNIADVKIYVVIRIRDECVKEELVISMLPDERVYNKILGQLKWISRNEVALISYTGETYICVSD